MPRLLLVAVILVAASSCDSNGYDPPEVAPPDPDALTSDGRLLGGTWTWERSVDCDGSGGCTEETPTSTGRTETLVVTPDEDRPVGTGLGGTVEGFFNGADIDPTEYEVVTACPRGVGAGCFSSFYFGEPSGPFVDFLVNRDRLVLSTEAVDGEETTYRRED